MTMTEPASPLCTGAADEDVMLQSPGPVDLIHHSSFADLFKQVKVSRSTCHRH